MDNSNDERHPWPYLATFKLKGVESKTVRCVCLLCAPKHTQCCAYINSPSNLRKHVEVCLLNFKCVQVYNQMNRQRKRNFVFFIRILYIACIDNKINKGFTVVIEVFSNRFCHRRRLFKRYCGQIPLSSSSIPFSSLFSSLASLCPSTLFLPEALRLKIKESPFLLLLPSFPLPLLPYPITPK
jgi:hypothetical protein